MQKNLTLAFAVAIIAFPGCAYAASIGATQSHTAHYCGYYTDGSTNCGFTSYDACAAAVSGVGGVCRISTAL